MRIARRFNAGKPPARQRVPKGRPIIAQPSDSSLGQRPTNASEPWRGERKHAMSETPSVVPDGTRFLPARKPSVETLGYCRLSLRDSKAAVFPFGRNGGGVQRYDLWVMTLSLGESTCLARKGVLSSLTGLLSLSHDHPAMNRWAIFGRPCGTWAHGAF